MIYASQLFPEYIPMQTLGNKTSVSKNLLQLNKSRPFLTSKRNKIIGAILILGLIIVLILIVIFTNPQIVQNLKCKFYTECMQNLEKCSRYECLSNDHLNCTESDFQCQNGEKCIPATFQCDSIYVDCSDGSDEENCFVCKTGNRKFAPLNKVCDGFEDCFDGSDEMNCEDFICPEFTCELIPWGGYIGKCLVNRKICDTKKDCIDGSDEENCDECKGGYLCKNKQCVVDDQTRCNGMKDCYDGSDEENCGNCTLGFLCNNKKCVYVYPFTRCNGEEDCEDGSDEEGCEDYNCPQGMYHIYPIRSS